MARTASVTARPVRPQPSIRRDSPRGLVPSTMPGSPVRRSDAPDASTSEICKQLARVVLDFAKPVFLTQPANRGIGIIVYKDPRNSRVDVPEYDLMVTESRMVWKSTVVTPRRGRENRTMSRRSSSIRRWRVPGAGQRG